MNLVADPIVSNDSHIGIEVKDWLEFLRTAGDNEDIDIIWKHSLTGRPCGDDRFVTGIEGLLGRRLRAMKWGRPRGKK